MFAPDVLEVGVHAFRCSSRRVAERCTLLISSQTSARDVPNPAWEPPNPIAACMGDDECLRAFLEELGIEYDPARRRTDADAQLPVDGYVAPAFEGSEKS